VDACLLVTASGNPRPSSQRGGRTYLKTHLSQRQQDVLSVYSLPSQRGSRTYLKEAGGGTTCVQHIVAKRQEDVEAGRGIVKGQEEVS
jgi:hypothetical protein